MKSPEQIIGADAVLALQFAGYSIVESEQGVSLIDASADDFEVLWRSYPHKVGKPAALRAYKAARKRKIKPETIYNGLQHYIETKPVDRPWLNLSTFCNQERWNDVPGRVTSPAKGADLFFASAMEGFDGYSGGNQGGAGLAAGGIRPAIADHSRHR